MVSLYDQNKKNRKLLHCCLSRCCNTLPRQRYFKEQRIFGLVQSIIEGKVWQQQSEAAVTLHPQSRSMQGLGTVLSVLSSLYWSRKTECIFVTQMINSREFLTDMTRDLFLRWFWLMLGWQIQVTTNLPFSTLTQKHHFLYIISVPVTVG